LDGYEGFYNLADFAMHVEVDQSGKIGDTGIATVLAFSDTESYAILIPAKVKKTCIQELRR